MIEKLGEWIDKRHEYAKDWKKRTGGRVVGYLCTYVPEEILYAADILPVRIGGGHEPSDLTLVEPHVFNMFCPFCRDCLSQGLAGKYDYLDGIMISQACLHLRQIFWSWQKHISHGDFDYYLPMPHCAQNPGRYEYLTAELSALRESIEKWIGRKITDEDLDKGIDIMNTNRKLLKQIYEFRKKDIPSITGLEAMELVLASQMMDKREHSDTLKELLKELPERRLDHEVGTRLMIIGSEDDDRQFFKMVEREMTVPATFVIEDHCTGSRYFWDEVVPQKDRLAAIAARYLDRVPCPNKDWPKRLRFPHILSLAKDFNAEGIILMQQKFCDPHELDMPALRKLLEDNGYPTYFLEFDILVPVGQFKTRVEAFVETMIELV